MWDQLTLRVLPSARRRWRSLSPDDRAVLLYALKDALKRPNRVGFYKLEFGRLGRDREIVQVHRSRFGHANFVLATTATLRLVICDLWLDDDVALAAE